MDKQDNRKLYVRVFDEIRRYILTNQLSAGDRLPTEFEMCDMFGVSRNALREAVKTLELMGIVKSSPGIGIVVQEYNMNFMFQQMFYFLVSDSTVLLKEILGIRKALELGFSRQAFDTVTGEEMKRLDEIVDRMGAKSLRGSLFRQEDKEFHLTLFSKTNNQMLNAIFTAAWDADSIFSVEEKKDFLSVYRNHSDIVKALKNHDLSAFMAAMEIHFMEAEYIKQNL